jgi:hypothetical protein
LLDWASRRAASLGKRWVRLDAWRSNAELQDYYSRRGFKRVRVVELPHRQSGALFERAAGGVTESGPEIIERYAT